MQAKVWVFPRIRVMLYDRVGPSFDFMPWMSDTVRGGFREEMLGQSNDYCAWTLDHYAGLDLRCGLSLNHLIFGYEVRNYSTERLTCANVRMYHSPKRVEHVSGRPDVGETATVRFTVYDQNHLLDREMTTPFPQIVKFEANGQLSSEYGIAAGGTVSVNWTPRANDILYAKLYDINGNVLSQDTVMVGACDSNVTTTTWVDLGLPSGLLWASHNVGATSPEDYGDYFAWGETSPKNVYDWSTYQYRNINDRYYHLTKYCNNSSYGYNGFTDTLTVLQPSDDAATVNMGAGARTPTLLEWEELYCNTTEHWTTYNGVYGRCLSGRNGNSIFLPVAGFRYDSSLYRAGDYGYYWSSSLYTDDPSLVWYYPIFGIISGYAMSSSRRCFGYTVRAVKDSGQK